MINLYEILQNIINESVPSDKVIDAIQNKYQVIINYSDEKARAPKKRLIEPYAYGISQAGNAVFRAFQYDGDTYRGKPKWKLFRLDRVESWTPTEQHFNVDPKTRGWNAPPYNEIGDDAMTNVLSMVDLNASTESNPFEKGSDLWVARQKVNNMQQSTPVNVNQMRDEPQGSVQQPIKTQTSDVEAPPSQPSISNNMTPDDFRRMINRNLELTKKEKERRGRNNLGQKLQPNNDPTQDQESFEKEIDKNLDNQEEKINTL